MARGDMKVDKIYEDDRFFAINDIAKRAPTDVLVIPKEHRLEIGRLHPDELGIPGEMIKIARTIADERGIAQSGFKLIFNSGPDSGMGIAHLHLHLIGGANVGGIT